MKTHKDLEVWKKSIELVTRLYGITTTFPSSETYAISNQIRRASVSIPANIAEGAARSHTREFHQFVCISLGSASEVETLLIIAMKLNYLANDTLNNVLADLESITRMLIALKRSLEK